MKFPDKCPACEKEDVYWIQRGNPDWDKDSPDRVVDTVDECSFCHTLYRFRWTLTSMHILQEHEIFEEEIRVVTKPRGGE